MIVMPDKSQYIDVKINQLKTKLFFQRTTLFTVRKDNSDIFPERMHPRYQQRIE